MTTQSIGAALAHNPAHANLVLARFKSAKVDVEMDTELGYAYRLDGSHVFTAENGHVEEVLSPIPEAPAAEPPKSE